MVPLAGLLCMYIVVDVVFLVLICMCRFGKTCVLRGYTNKIFDFF